VKLKSTDTRPSLPAQTPGLTALTPEEMGGLTAALPTQCYVVVSAVTAREWLKHNTSNRPLRRSRVDDLKRMFERGEYIVTHQGIAFGADGLVQDGQHRLTALSEMPDDFSVVLSVTRGLAKAAFEVLDIGVKRTYSDALRISRGLAEVSRFLAAIVEGTGAMSPQALRSYVDFVRPHYDTLLADMHGNRRAWSSASVRGAAIICMARGIPADYVRSILRALMTADFNAMPPVAQAVFRAELNGRISATEKNDMFVRCLKIFNPKFAGQSKVLVKDASTDVAEVREFLNGVIPKDQASLPL